MDNIFHNVRYWELILLMASVVATQQIEGYKEENLQQKEGKKREDFRQQHLFSSRNLSSFQGNPSYRKQNFDVTTNPSQNAADSTKAIPVTLKTQSFDHLRNVPQTMGSSATNLYPNQTNFPDLTANLFYNREYSANPDFVTFSWQKSQTNRNINPLIKALDNRQDFPNLKELDQAIKPQQIKELLKFTKTNRKPSKILQILGENLTLTNLKSLESVLKVDTLVLYGSRELLKKYSPEFQKNHPPLILFSERPNKELRFLFSTNMLSIIFLSSQENPLENPLLLALNNSLNRRHLAKLILVTEAGISPDFLPFQPLFYWLHNKGFWNSLLMDISGNSLTFDPLKAEFIRNLSLREFLLKDINWPDLKHYPISCFMGSNPPRVYIQREAPDVITLKGYYGTIINLFVKYYNASLKPYVLTDSHYYTELDCVKYIRENKVDICGDVLTMHTDYVITNPEEIALSHLMVPYDKPLARFYYFLKPFQLPVWTIVNCSFFYKVFTLSLIHRLQHGTWNCSLQIIYATLSVMFLPFHLTHVKGPYRKFLELLMILVGFVVANWYLSVLSSLLFTRLYSHDINSLEDLVQQNISIMVNEFDVYLLNNTVNDPIIKQQLQVVSNEVLLQHRRNLDPRYAYYSQYDKIEFYLHQQKFLLRPRMKVLSGIPPINEVLAGIPMSPNWPFQHLLNGFMRRILDSGLYQRLLVNAREEGIVNGYLHYFPTEHHYVEPLSIEYFQMPATLLAVGYTLALVGFLLEMFVFKGVLRGI